MITDLPIVEKTAIVYYDSKKKITDTSLEKNLCNYDTVRQIYYNLNSLEISRHTSTRDFQNIYNYINTAQHKISGSEKYVSLINEYHKSAIKTNSFIKSLKSLFNNNSDDAIIFVFDVIDDLHPVNDILFFNELFKSLQDIKFNEDIYISILSSTILLKNNSQRMSYFQFVKNELLNKYNSTYEVENILKGL